VAKVLSLSLVVFPSPGMITYCRMREAFGEGRFRSFQLAWGWIARPFRDFVILKRVLYGREDVSNWRIIERNSDEVASLRETGQSFIVATAHFQRAALIATACPRVTPGNFVAVGLPSPREIKSLYDLRLRIQFGTLLTVLSSAWHRPFEFAFTKSSRSAASLLYERLRERGNIIYIHVDAPWQKSATGSYTRPFAGQRGRDFSTGAAQLAELTQCPIVSCVYWQEDDETVVLKWGSPIQRVDNEIDTMNRLIDTLEVAVGERPTQYMLDIGGERRWNPMIQRWEDINE
jgi:lauroyl/myristoyl acyltransferase